MKSVVSLILVVAMVGAAHASFFPRIRRNDDKPDAPHAAAFLNAFFGLGYENVNFNHCEGTWREKYLDERLEAADELFRARADQDQEAKGVDLLLHGVFELTYDFTGCLAIQGAV